MSPIDSIIISTNFWRVPSVERAFNGFLEGRLLEKRRQQIIAEAKAAREAWTPSDEGMQLVEQLKEFVGFRIRIQFWDSIMWILEEEGPYPIEVNCVGVMFLKEEGFLQAFIEVSDPQEFKNDDGYSPSAYFQKREGSVFDLASVADIYSVSKVVTP